MNGIGTFFVQGKWNLKPASPFKNGFLHVYLHVIQAGNVLVATGECLMVKVSGKPLGRSEENAYDYQSPLRRSW
jgi:hypothetical protein